MNLPESKKYNIEFFMVCLFNIFAIVFLFQVRNLNETAALFPRIVSTFVLILGVSALISRVRPGKRQFRAPESQETVRDIDAIQTLVKKEGTLSWLVSLSWAGAYFLLLFIVGFVIATLLYALVIPLAMEGFNKRNVRTGIIFALLMALAMIGFERAFYIDLPQGYLLELMP